MDQSTQPMIEMRPPEESGDLELWLDLLASMLVDVAMQQTSVLQSDQKVA